MLTAGAEGFGVILERHLAAAGAPADASRHRLRHGRRAPGLARSALCRAARQLSTPSSPARSPSPARPENPHPARPRAAQHRSARRHARRGDPACRHPAAVCGGQPPRLHARHAFEMGRGRRRRHRRLPHLDHRRAVLHPVEAIDPAPFARRDALAALPDNPVFRGAAPRRSAKAGDIGSSLFRIRAATLLQDLKPDDAAATLSGLLIGARNRLGAPHLRRGRRQGHPRRVRPARAALQRRAEACRLDRASRSTPTRPSAPACSRPQSASAGWKGPPHEHALPEAAAATWSPSCAACRPTRRWRSATAVFEAGIEAIEVPLNSPDPFTSIERLAKALPASALVGAGTVLTPEDVDDLHEAGGRLLVSPNIDRAVMERADRVRHGHHARRVHADRGLSGALARRVGAEILPGERARARRASRRSWPCCRKTTIVGAVGGVSDKDFADYGRIRRPHLRPGIEPVFARA